MTQTDATRPDEPKPDEPQGVKGSDAELASAYERIKTAQGDLARLDRLVSGMERGDRPSIPQKGTGPEPGGAAVSETPPQRTPENNAPRAGVRRGRPTPLVLIGLMLAICIFGAVFVSRYGNAAKAIMARWAPPVSVAHEEVSAPRAPATLLMAQAADSPEQPSAPAAPSPKETKDVPPPVATPSADRTSTDHASADLAQSIQTITHDLASISEKLDQLKNNYDQTLREQADAIQQLRTKQEQGARDNARVAAQIQAMQAQLAASSAKPAAEAPKKETDVAPHRRQSVAASPRPRRPPASWRPRIYLDDSPWDDPYW